MKAEPLTSATHPELLAWVDANAGLEKLCLRGGWPDPETIRIEPVGQKGAEQIVDIYFTEAVREMSECDPVREERCGQFAISFDPAGQPDSIRLLFPM
jgi:hypothetical protein